ncbi:transglutaminase family protein [Brevundimonas sp. 2R-24]|uniref:Transglutaminase family protein n=1 Tax=Peiella sedimenti TaxID=3061083 RepID=A0ABT8SQT7_9CAUL|nr:transglutaminase family protein [Caulobacteraceae bacterium XZ-24]
MTREEAEDILTEAGQAQDDAFPLLEAAIACAIHDRPFRDPSAVRTLAARAVERLRERAGVESPEEALAETLSGELGLDGDLMDEGDLEVGDIIAVADRRRGLSAVLGVFYIHAGLACGLNVQGVDFPGHFLLRVDTREGPVAIDPFSQGRLVLPSELTRRALRAGLTPAVADRLDLLMAPINRRQSLVRLQDLLFIRAIRAGDYPAAEGAALRKALLDPSDHRPWLDVAQARERQGALAGALSALDQAKTVEGDFQARLRQVRERVRLRLN